MKTNNKLNAYILRGSTTVLLFSCVIVALCLAINLPEQTPRALPPQGAESPTPTSTCAPPPPDIVSWWPGDDNADDIIDGNDGILQNGATFATGLVDQAFLLDGIDDFVDVGNAPNLHVSEGEFTVDAWVYFNALQPAALSQRKERPA